MAGVSGGGRGGKTRSAGLQPFNPQRLHAAVLKTAPQFKVRHGHHRSRSASSWPLTGHCKGPYPSASIDIDLQKVECSLS